MSTDREYEILILNRVWQRLHMISLSLYMNDCAGIIEAESMTARCFNDFVCYNRRSDCNLYKTVQVCHWSNQWNGSEYNTRMLLKMPVTR